MANREIITPRQMRALKALLTGPVPREQLDRICGASNSPDVIYQLRKQGLRIPCVKQEALDRDGHRCRTGIYQLTLEDAELVRRLSVAFSLGELAS